MAIDVGSVLARLGTQEDFAGFDRFEKRMDKAEADARRRNIKANLGADYDPSEVDAYGRALDKVQARVRRREDFKAKLGADYDPAAFRAFERDLNRTERQASTTTQRLRDMNTQFTSMRNIISVVRPAALITGLGLAAQGANALAAGAGGVVSSLSSLVGVVPAAAQGVSALGQAFGTAALASVGVGDAIKAGLEQQAKASAGAGQELQKQRAAAEGVRSAKLSLAAAQRTAKIAQEDLTGARREATRQLDDLSRAAKRSHLDEEAAVNAVREARVELSKTLDDPKAAGLDVDEARLRVRQAEQDLSDVREQGRRARQDFAEAQSQGAEGLPQVVAAKRSLAEADRSVAEAARSVRLAQRDATAEVAKASPAADKFAQAMAKLPPAAQRFVRFVISLKDEVKDLRATAAQGLFPGVEDGVRSAMRNFPALERVVGLTSRTLGELVRQAGDFVGSKGFGRDFELVGERNTRVITRAGRAGLDLASAFRHVVVAAGPLTNWLSLGAARFAHLIDKEAEAGRESGRMGEFFEETRKVLQRVFSIAQSLAAGFVQVGRAAKPLGDEILAAIDRSAQRWEDWSESLKGQNALRKYFQDARAPLFETGKLVGDIAKAFLRLGSGDETASLIRKLRTDLLPVFEDLVRTTTKDFGPVLIDALVKVTRLFATLAGSSGPLTVFVATIGRAADGFRWLLEHIPGLKGAVVGLAATASIYKALGIASAITGLGTLRTRLLGLLGLGKSGGGLGRVLGGAASARGATPANPLFVSDVSGALGGRGPGAVAPAPTGALGKVKGALRGAGKLGAAAAAIDLAVNLVDQRGNPISAVINSAHDLTFGLIPKVGGKSAGDRKDEAVVSVDKELEEALKKRDTGQIDKVKDKIRAMRDEAKRFGDEKLAKQFDDLLRSRSTAGLDRIINNLARFRSTFPRLKTEDIIDPNAVAQALANMNRLRSGTVDRIRDIRESMAFNVRKIGDGLKEGSRSWVTAMNTNMRAGVRAVELLRKDGVVSAKQGSEEILRIIRTNMRRVASTMDENSEKGKDGLRENMQAARAAIKTSIDRGAVDADKGMRTIRRLLERELKSFGFTTEQAKRYARGDDPLTGKSGDSPGRGQQRGGWIRRAAGGWIGGRGLVSDDVVPIAPGVLAAYGEYDANGPGGRRAVLNRHQAPYAELALALGGYPSLDRLPAGGQLPYIERAMGALGGLDALFAAVNRPHMFQRGGIVPIPGEPGESIHSSILQDVLRLKSRYKLDITDGYATTGHAPGGEHPKGLAIDAVPGPGGSWDLIDRLNAWARTQLGRVFRWIGYDGVPNHGRGNHIHLSWIAGKNMSGTGPGAASIPRQRTGLPGMLGGVVQGALDLSRAGANRLLDRAASAVTPDVNEPGAAQGADANVIQAFRRAIRTTRARSPEPLALFEAGIVESGLKNLQYGDRDSLGSLQERVSIFGRAHALDPYASATRFLRDAISKRPWKGTAGQLAQAVQRSAFPERYDQAASQARRYLQRGGRVGSVGKGTALQIRGLRKLQGTRIEEFEDLQAAIDTQRKRYEQVDRRYNQSDEVLIDEQTGAINEQAIRRRAQELEGLIDIRKRIFHMLGHMLRVARRVVRTYSTILQRLQTSLRHAPRKDRSGIRDQIEHYQTERGEWRGIVKDLPFDVEDARLDVVDITNERLSVLGTQAEARQAEFAEPETSESPESTAETGKTPDEEAQIARAQEIIAAGVTGQIAEAVTRYIATNSADLGFAPGAQQYGAPSLQRTPPDAQHPFGGTTVVQNIYTLHPGDPQTLRAVGDAATAGQGYQPSVRNIRSVPGV